MPIRTLLVRPPNRYNVVPACDIPLGLMYLASSLRKSGREVQIYDALAEVNLASAEKKSNRVHLVELAWNALGIKIRQSRPDMVGITNLFSAQLESSVAAAEIVKSIDKGILTVVGGNHASTSPQSFFEMTEAIDVACLGEGEITILDIARYREAERRLEDIGGIAFRKKGRMVINQPRTRIKNLDDLPFPSYDLVDLESYFSAVRRGLSGRAVYPYPGSERAISVITSRGCPYECLFCSIHLHMGRGWRCHSAEYVIDHLEYVVMKYGVRHVHFEDDNLTLNLPRFVAILDGIIEKGLDITWDTPNGVRADHLTKDLLVKCKRAGCIYLYIGVESGVQRVLDQVIRKKLNLDAVTEVASWCREIGLDLGAFYVIGFPGEKKEEVRKTLEFALTLEQRFGTQPDVMFATPLPGTKLYQICSQNDLFDVPPTPLNLSRAIDGVGMIRTEEFTPGELANLRKEFYRKHKLLSVRNFLAFALRRPRGLCRFLANVFSGGNGHKKQRILANMFLRNCLTRDFWSVLPAKSESERKTRSK